MSNPTPATTTQVKELLLSDEENRYVIFPFQHEFFWKKQREIGINK